MDVVIFSVAYNYGELRDQDSAYKYYSKLVTKFSEGEVRVKINEDVRGRDVFIVQSTCPPTNCWTDRSYTTEWFWFQNWPPKRFRQTQRSRRSDRRYWLRRSG